MAQKRPSSNLSEFKEKLTNSNCVFVLTGAGISAESGIPTFRGPNSLWRNLQPQTLACFDSFNEDPSLVWELYHYRREIVLKSKPNAGHLAIAKLQIQMEELGRKVIVATQNVDGLHTAAGTKNLIELHGNLFDVKCTKCQAQYEDKSSPICEGLRGKGDPNPSLQSDIPQTDLPRCKRNNCGGLLRPGVVWFGESLDGNVLKRTYEAMEKCDLCLVVGTSSVVYPAAGFASEVRTRGVPVAEFNLDITAATNSVDYHFEGKSGEILPDALNAF